MRTHGLFAVERSGDVRRYVKVDDFETYDDALKAWYVHDDARRAGRRPHVSFYAVRALDDPKWRTATRDASAARDALTKRGFTHIEDAARRALVYRTGKEVTFDGARTEWKTRTQGEGGWFYFGGRTFAQGLHDLAERAVWRGWVRHGFDGKWHALGDVVEVDPSTTLEEVVAAWPSR